MNKPHPMRAMRAAVVATLLALLGACAQTPRQPEMTPALVREAVQRLPDDERLMNIVVTRKFGTQLDANKRAVALAQQRRFFRHPLAQEAVMRGAEPVLARGGDVESLGQVIADVAMTRGDKGMARLPLAQRRVFMDYVRDMARQMPADRCNMLLDKQGGALAATDEMAWLAQQPLPRFERVLSLYVDASLLEIEGKPLARDAAKTQEALARYGQRLRVASSDSFGPSALARVLKSQGEGRENCEYGALMMQVLLAMPAADFDLVSAHFLSNK